MYHPKHSTNQERKHACGSSIFPKYDVDMDCPQVHDNLFAVPQFPRENCIGSSILLSSEDINNISQQLCNSTSLTADTTDNASSCVEQVISQCLTWLHFPCRWIFELHADTSQTVAVVQLEGNNNAQLVIWFDITKSTTIGFQHITLMLSYNSISLFKHFLPLNTNRSKREKGKLFLLSGIQLV